MVRVTYKSMFFWYCSKLAVLCYTLTVSEITNYKISIDTCKKTQEPNHSLLGLNKINSWFGLVIKEGTGKSL